MCRIENATSSQVGASTEGIHDFLPSVSPFVSSKGRALAEGFPTQVTSVRFLSGVRSLVAPKGGAFTEGFATLTTSIRLLPSVRPLVLSEVG